MIGRIFILATLMVLTACADRSTFPESAARFPLGKSEAALEGQFPVSLKNFWLAWEVFPTEQDMGSFVLKTGRPNAADESPLPQDIEGEIKVAVLMPSMNHDSGITVRVEKLDVGTYRASKVFFSMNGDWEIHLQRFVNGIQVEQAIVPIRF